MLRSNATAGVRVTLAPPDASPVEPKTGHVAVSVVVLDGVALWDVVGGEVVEAVGEPHEANPITTDMAANV
jgi:hypothetical protein